MSSRSGGGRRSPSTANVDDLTKARTELAQRQAEVDQLVPSVQAAIDAERYYGPEWDGWRAATSARDQAAEALKRLERLAAGHRDALVEKHRWNDPELVARRTTYANSQTVGGTYLVRNTLTPEHDVERGWSGWMGHAYDSREEAEAAILEQVIGNGELADRWENAQAHGQTDYHTFLGEQAEDENISVAHNSAYDKWQWVHHDGLSGYALRSDSIAGARREVRDLAKQMGSSAAAYPWHDFGDTTSGKIVYLGPLGGTLHLFWAQDTRTEAGM